VPLVWITGVSGSGKSSVCEALKEQGRVAVDADSEGLSQWVHRVTGEPVVNPPYPVPAGWLRDFGWRVRPEAVESLEGRLASEVGFLCGGFENDDDVWPHFDRVVCLAVDEATLRARLTCRTTNHFGKHPEELQAALGWRLVVENQYRERGAVIVDATQPLNVVVAQVLAAAET
jgi:gluconate kinase